MILAIRRGIIVFLGLLAQLFLTFVMYKFLIDNIAFVSLFYTLLSILLVLYLIKDSKNYSYTLPWIIILIWFPLVGTILYVILGKNKHKSKLLKCIVKHEEESKKYLIQDKKIRDEFKENSKLRYISDFSGYPVTTNNEVDYYPLGEKAFEIMLEELKKQKNLFSLNTLL